MLLGGLFGFALVLTVLYSFWQVVDFEVGRTGRLTTTRYFFSVDTYVRTFVATLAMVAVATVLTLAARMPFAYWLTRYVSRRWRRRLLSWSFCRSSRATCCACTRGSGSSGRTARSTVSSRASA